MNKNNLVFLFVIVFVSHFYGQKCETVPMTIPEHFDLKFAELDDSAICIDVYFHVVRESNGAGGFNPNHISTLVNQLNFVFNPYNIYINRIGSGFINNDNLYFIDDLYEFEVLMNTNNIPNAINFYIPNGAYFSGRSQDIPSRNFAVSSFFVFEYSIHEFGHALGLYHTFHGTVGPPGCPENIDGSNCNVCGDLVCDTPADSLEGHSNGYTPDMNNYMSYYDQNSFTSGQISRMRTTLLNSSVLEPVLSNKCISIKIVGSDVICDTNNYTYFIQNKPPYSSFSWVVPSYFQIISSNSNSITLKLNSVPPTGGVTVNLQVVFADDGHIVSKKIRLGKPSSPGFNGPVVVQPSHVVWYEVADPNPGSTYVWTFPSGWDFNPNMDVYRVWGKALASGQNGYVTVQAFNDCGSSDIESLYVIAQSGGGGEPKYWSMNEEFLLIFPNPVSNYINILCECAMNKIKIYSLDGKKVYEILVMDNNIEADISFLNQGLYIVEIEYDNMTKNYRRIVVK